MNTIANVQEPAEIRQLASVELDQIGGGFGWFDLLEAACFTSLACSAGYLGHMLFREP